MSSSLRELARFVVGLKIEEVPQKVLDTASRCVLDTISSAVGGAYVEQVIQIRKMVLNLYGEKGTAGIWSTGKNCAGPVAAFLNAMSGHALELDDVHTISKTHIGTVVVPAAWAAAQTMNCSGREFLLAVLCGYETAARIGMGFGVSSHRSQGWHATSTAGIFGAAAACAKLFQLDEDETVSALGIAGTQAFGTWAFLGDGASNKTLHPARAASCGFEAACFAKAGMTGAEHILDASDGGLYRAMTDAPKLEAVSSGLGNCWEILRIDTKPYPCCRSTHCGIDAALVLREQYGVQTADVNHIVVNTYEVGYMQCGLSEGSKRPTTAIEAKFSTPYTVACALLRGNVTLQDFTSEAIADEAVQALLQKVTVEPTERFTEDYPMHWGCELNATLKDGHTCRICISDASGSVMNPLTQKQALQKAESLLSVLYGVQAASIAGNLLRIAEFQSLPAI